MPPVFKSLKKRRERKQIVSSLRVVTEAGHNRSSKHLKGSSPTGIGELDGSQWHRWVHSRDWNSLRHALEESQNDEASLSPQEKSSKFSPRFSNKSPRTSTHNKRSPMSSIHKRSPTTPMAKKSPKFSTHKQKSLPTLLLDRDSSGDTVLHLALNQHGTPIDIIQGLLNENPDLAATENRKGQLALHVAMQENHAMKVIVELVLANPAGVMFEDQEGETPLNIAVRNAKQHNSKIPKEHRRWDRDMDDDEFNTDVMLLWQADQNAHWAVVKWLLLASASHPRTSLNVGSNQSLLMDALLCSAPPSVVSLLVAASSTVWESSFACSALYLCIARRYPLPILESIALQSPNKARIVRDETGMGLVSAQYICGCFYQLRTGDWSVVDRHKEMMEDCIFNKNVNVAYPSFQDWWDKMKFLIRYCVQGASTIPDDQLLHAALSNADVSPTTVRLLLALHPSSASVPDPMSGAHPLHLVSMTETYIPRNYEPSAKETGTALEMVAKLHSEAVRYRFHDKLPLHLALDAGKTWTEIKPLTSAHRRSLSKRDPTTKLYPFQLVSMKRETEANRERLTFKARNMYSHDVWRQMSSRRKNAALKKVQQRENLERIRTCYEFLRRNPGLVKTGIVNQKNLHEARDTTGMGMVAAHFTLWCYGSEQEKWKPLVENQRILQDATATGTLNVVENAEKAREFKDWWAKMKFWIWYCSAGEEGSIPIEGYLVIPRSDKYLLHAAASNSDTPPQVVDLLLNLFPSSASLPLPQTTTYPLHIAASTTSYTPREFESDYFSTLSLLLRAYPEAANIRFRDRLPLNIAIETGKTWEELQPLVKVEKRALRCRDLTTGLYPFQLMAVHHTYTPEQRRRFQYLARNRNKHKKWKKMSQSDKTREIKSVQKEYRLSVVNAIFELLREDAILAGISPDNEKDKSPAFIPSESGDSQDQSSTATLQDDDVSDDDDDDEETVEPLLTTAVARNQMFGSKASFEDDASVFSTFDVMSTISALQHEEEDAVVNDSGVAGVTEKDYLATGPSPMHTPESQSLDVLSDAPTESVAVSVKQHVATGPLGESPGAAARSFDESSNPHDGAIENEDVGSVESDDDGDIWSYVQQLEQRVDGARRETRARKDTESPNQNNENVSPAEAQDVGDLKCDEMAGQPPGGRKAPTKPKLETTLTEQEALKKTSAMSKLSKGTATNWGELQTTPQSEKSLVAKDVLYPSANLKAIPESQQSPTADPLKDGIMEASGKLKATPDAERSLVADPLIAELAEASGKLKHHEPESQKDTTPDVLREGIVEATGKLKHSIPSHPERRPRFVQKDRKEVTDVEKRVGVYRTGWTQTPAVLQRRRRHQFGRNYVNMATDKGLPCVLCGQGKREVLMLPCRHLCLCSRCSVTKKISTCKTCGKDVDNWMTVFL